MWNDQLQSMPSAKLGLVRPRSVIALCIGLALMAGSSRGDDSENCLFCHQYAGLSRFNPATGQVHLFGINPAYVRLEMGPHARLSCTDCHPREEVSVIPHQPVSKVDCTRQCHLARPDGQERRFSHENIAQMLDQGVHKKETLSTLNPSGGPLLNTGQSLCLYCHDEPVFRADAVPRTEHGRDLDTSRCAACHTTQIPLNTGYMLRHVVARVQPVRPSLEIAQVCSICHSDPKILAARGADDPIGSFVRSFHGKAVLLGDPNAANCLDCHVGAGQNVHLMLGPKEPTSSVNSANLPDACIRCHKQADVSIASTSVHLDLPRAAGSIDYLIGLAFILITIGTFVPSAILVILELLQQVIGRHAHGHSEIRLLAERVARNPQGAKRLKRFTRAQRVQHWVLALLFAALALTGFPMKFAAHSWAGTLIGWFGGLATARVVHHWAGVGLVVGFGLHVFTAVAGAIRDTRRQGSRDGSSWAARLIQHLPMVMTLDDLKRTGQLMAYLLGLRAERPTFRRFTGPEKFEYFGVLWGTTLLGLTGLILWGQQEVSHWFSGRTFNIATIFHTYEAFLAIIHVGILHIVNVTLSPHVFPLSLATLTGRTPTAKLAEENGAFVMEVANELGISTVSDEAHGERDYE